ncbi:MAG: TPM domain-containing protein [Burkholderiales bacterium]
MSAIRWCRHVFAAEWLVWRAFPKKVLSAIEACVTDQEKRHDAELRFVVEGGLPMGSLWRGRRSRARAIEVFGALRVWDTEHNSGVLIYVLLADRCVEILADRGIEARVGSKGWEVICGEMRKQYAAGNFESGSIHGIRAISDLLAEHFPPLQNNPNELSDKPVVL